MYEDKLRPLKNQLTDFVNEWFLRYDEQNMRILRDVFWYIGDVCNKIISLYNLQKNDCLVIFKGGNVLRVIGKNFEDQFPSMVSQKIVSEYNKFLKKSDNDFSVYLNPFLHGYPNILSDLQQRLEYALVSLRNRIESRLPEYFEFFKYDEKVQDQLLASLIKKSNKLNIVKGKVIQNIQLFPREDIRITCKDLDDYTYYKLVSQGLIDECEPDVQNLDNGKHICYNSFNQTLFFGKKETPIKFILDRTKFSFQVTYADEKFNLSSGELIDISIPLPTDLGFGNLHTVQDFRDYVNDTIYKGYYNDPKTQLEFNYNMINNDYIIHDLIKILFREKEFPWDDPKYAKRVNRLMLFYLIEIMGKEKITMDRLDEIIEDFTNLIDKIYGKNRMLSLELEHFYSLIAHVAENVRKNQTQSSNYQLFVETIQRNVNAIVSIISTLKSYMEDFGLENIYDLQKTYQGGSSNVQSVIFDKNSWTVKNAAKWLMQHKYVVDKVDITDNYLRFRQNEPDYKKYRYRTYPITGSIKLILGYPKKKDLINIHHGKLS